MNSNGSSEVTPSFFSSIIADARANASASNDASIQEAEVDEFADIAEYMPVAPYRPRKQGIDESPEQYEIRLTTGLKRHKGRRRQIAALIRKAIEKNTDPSMLSSEIDAVLKANQEVNKERGKVKGSLLATVGISRSDFESIPKDLPGRQEIVNQGVKMRNRSIKVNRYRRMYKAATNQDKEGILRQAFKAGITLEEMTRRKFAPSIFDLQPGEEIEPEQEPRIFESSLQSGQSNGHLTNGWQEASASDTINSDWLSLGLPDEASQYDQADDYYSQHYDIDQMQQHQDRLQREQLTRDFLQQQESATEAALSSYPEYEASAASNDVTYSGMSMSEYH